jgi:hypothetical protein
MILVAVMFGWMVLVFVLAQSVASKDPNVEVPVKVNLGVIVTPADGWYSAAKVWDAGPTGVTFQNSGAYVAFWAEQYEGSNEDLLSEWVGILRQQYDSLRTLPATATTVAGGIPALASVFSGVVYNERREGEVVVSARDGLGVVMWADAGEGQLARIQGDLESMLDGMVVGR